MIDLISLKITHLLRDLGETENKLTCSVGSGAGLLNLRHLRELLKGVLLRCLLPDLSVFSLALLAAT